METHYTIISEPHPIEHSITLLLNGKFSEDALPELEQSISQAKNGHNLVLIDLSEVTLVDRKAIQYISRQASHDVKLVNCPVYLWRWISQVSNEAQS